MSTRSIIGIATDSGFEGRYCHWDGYPSWRGLQIARTYEQLHRNVMAVRAWCTRRHDGDVGYWSSFLTPHEFLTEEAKPAQVPCEYCAGTGTRPDYSGPYGCNACKGSGLMPNPDRREGWRADNGNGWVSSSDDCGAEWAYLISDDALTVLSYRYADDESQAVGMFGMVGAEGWWRVEAMIPWASVGSTDWEAIERTALLVDPVPSRI